ncbi:MAG: translation initiation factor IF-2 N-terminal domain-containing protein [Syntrophotaleaceae bacterium]
MGEKMRVHELALKLGLDNKTLLERLKTAGIEVKSHLSVLDASTVELFSSEQSPVETAGEKVVEEKIEEERINPGIIRRRRKEVPKASAPEPPAPELPTEEPSASTDEIVEKEEPVIDAVWTGDTCQ